MNKIRLNTIGEVVSKQSSSGGGDLQIKSVAITENGTQAVTPDAGFGGMSKVVVNTDVNTQQGLDFSEIYDAEQADEINQFYKDGIEYAEEIKLGWNKNLTSLYGKFSGDRRLVIFPQVDMSNVTNMASTFFSAVNLEYISENLNTSNLISCQSLFGRCYGLKRAPKIDTSKVANLSQMYVYCYNLESDVYLDTQSATNLSLCFSGCVKLPNIKLTSVSNVTNFSSAFSSCEALETLQFEDWKRDNLVLNFSYSLTPSSIHYIIQNAMDVADGATARTLTLHRTSKTNWENSEYYEQDLAVLSTKGITIA